MDPPILDHSYHYVNTTKNTYTLLGNARKHYENATPTQDVVTALTPHLSSVLQLKYQGLLKTAQDESE